MRLRDMLILLRDNRQESPLQNYLSCTLDTHRNDSDWVFFHFNSLLIKDIRPPKDPIPCPIFRWPIHCTSLPSRMRRRKVINTVILGGWVNQAYSRLSTTHGHITDCKLDSVVYASELMWICVHVWYAAHITFLANNSWSGVYRSTYSCIASDQHKPVYLCSVAWQELFNWYAVFC